MILWGACYQNSVEDCFPSVAGHLEQSLLKPETFNVVVLQIEGSLPKRSVVFMRLPEPLWKEFNDYSA